MAARQIESSIQGLSHHQTQLSKAVLEAFETRGWHWSDEQLLEDIRDLVTPPLGTFVQPKKIREKLVRKLGESQVFPRPGFLLSLCRRFRAVLLSALFDCPKAYDNVRAGFVDPVFDTELQGIVDSSDLFPVPYAPREEAWFRAITGLTKTLSLVDSSILASIELNTVLWVIGMAATRVARERRRLHDLKTLQRYHGVAFVNEDLAAQRKEQAAQEERAQLRAKVLELPAEIRMIIYIHLAANLTRVWPINSNPEYAARCCTSMLKLLSDVELVPEFSINSSGLIHRDPYRSANLKEITAALGSEVEEALMKKLHVDQAIDFPLQYTQSQVTPPRIINDHTPRICHLNLTVRMIMLFSQQWFYPSALYSAGKNIVGLKQLFPNLKTVEVTILDRLPGDGNVLIIPESRQGDYTTKRMQIAGFIERFLELDIDERWVRYKTDSRLTNYDDRVEASEQREMEGIELFVEATMSYEGAACEVRRVGSGIGSIAKGAEARRAAREWSWA